jgi:hypothetical protein
VTDASTISLAALACLAFLANMQDAGDYDDSIDTSDAEESEAMQAMQQDYWSTHLPHVRTAYSLLDHSDMRAGQISTPDRLRINSVITPRHTEGSGNHSRKRLKASPISIS